MASFFSTASALSPATISAVRAADRKLADAGGSDERPYVSASWLKKAKADSKAKVKVIDVSWRMDKTPPSTYDDFKLGHIPTASYIDIDAVADLSNPKPHAVPSPETFKAAMEDAGVGEGDIVVLYDSAVGAAAARFWWTCDVFGLPHVRILDGGLKAWAAAGGELAAGPGPAVLQPEASGNKPSTVNSAAAGVIKPLVLTPKVDRSARVVDSEWIKGFVAAASSAVPASESRSAAVADAAGEGDIVIDARSEGRFTGKDPEPRPNTPSGHYPGALNVPFTDLLFEDPVSGITHLKSAPELEFIFKSRGALPTPAQRAVLSCGSGLTACMLGMGLRALGRKDTAVFDGSWLEYTARAAKEGEKAFPIVKGGSIAQQA